MNTLRLRLLPMVVLACAACTGTLFSTARAAEGRRLVSIDCTADLPPDQYFGHGAVRVVDSPIGRYREAEGRPLSRFGYRFKIEHIGKPHLLVIRYPDDKRRFMCVMDGTTYDTTTGVFTDFAQPLSGKMLEIREVFWPRWNDCSVVMMTWSNGEPAAAAQIEVFELDELPPLDLPSAKGAGPLRQFGIQYEDPCGRCDSEGAINSQEWLDRITAYARYSGQNLLTYPIVWYHGPFYPSQREPSGDFGTIVGRDRKQYGRWTTHPADWVAPILDRFGREDMSFQGALTLLRLGSLMKRMNIDLESIKAGKDTINNMLASNNVQAGTQDWTPLYNVLNFQAKVEGRLSGWAYGEKDGQPYPARPIFNPLHPVVQEAVLGLVQEIADRYGRYPAFKGISLNMWHGTILWYAALDTGYDDYTVGLFEKETGIALGVDPKAPDRFSQRHAILTGPHREKWIAWRCGKIHELFGRIRDIMVRARPDLRVTVSLWTETTMPKLVGMPNSPAQQLCARPRTVDLYRQGGFDVNLFRDDPGIEIDYVFVPERDRDGWGTAGVDTPLESMCMFRDHDFLDSDTLATLAGGRRPGALIFNSWVEAWGNHKWFACDPGDTQAATLADMDGTPAEGMFRMNSEYPKDDFWWDSQLRITPPFPAGVHFLEYFAHAVAELDACRVTSGGLFLDTAHADAMQRFARAYRALPAEKFQTVGDRTDPVAVRTLVHGARRYVYLVNRDYYPVAVQVNLASPAGQATDLATGQKVDAPAQWALTLGPYELRTYALTESVGVAGFQAHPPEAIVHQLKAETDAALAAVQRLRAAGKPLPPGAETLAEGLSKAIQEGRLAWVRRALTSYGIRKSLQQAPEEKPAAK